MQILWSLQRCQPGGRQTTNYISSRPQNKEDFKYISQTTLHIRVLTIQHILGLSARKMKGISTQHMYGSSTKTVACISTTSMSSVLRQDMSSVPMSHVPSVTLNPTACDSLFNYILGICEPIISQTNTNIYKES